MNLKQAMATINDLQTRLDQAEHRANHDDLTGLHNRRGWERHATDLITRAWSVISVAILDVNKFKQINDTHGHAVGDVVISEIGTRLGKVFGAAAGRLGGDEFVVISESPDMFDQLLRGATTLPETSEHPAVTASIGVHTFTPGTTPLHAALKAADAAMYKNKQATKREDSGFHGNTNRCDIRGYRNPRVTGTGGRVPDAPGVTR